MKVEIAAIEITPAGADAEEQQDVLEMVQPSPGFATVANFLVDIIHRQAFTTVIDFTPKAASIKFLMDGVWQKGAPMERETADFMLAVLKKIAGLNHAERRLRQEGKFNTLYRKVRQSFRVVCQGVPTGERVAIYVDWKRSIPETLEDLGMRESMRSGLSQILNNPLGGMVLVAGVPSEGYTSVWRGTLSACDRLVRDFYVIEEVNEFEPEVINFFSITYDRSKGENAMTPITQLMLKQPDFLAFNELPDGKTVDDVVRLSINQNKPMLVRAPGRNVFDALLRLMVLQPDAEALVNRLDAIVCMRLIRKLCEKCKISYTPAPAMLQKMGIPAGRIGKLYKPNVFQPGSVDDKEEPIQPCKYCQGVGFRDRTGLFELLVLNDEIRQLILKKPRLDYLMAKVQDFGHISMQQEGIVLVAKGIVSIDELQRVLKN